MYQDPGDDEREALRMRNEAGQSNNWKWAIGILIGGPAVVSLLLWWATR